MQELLTFEKRDVSEFQESGQFLDDCDAYSKCDDSWSLGSNKNYFSRNTVVVKN